MSKEDIDKAKQAFYDAFVTAKVREDGTRPSWRYTPYRLRNRVELEHTLTQLDVELSSGRPRATNRSLRKIAAAMLQKLREAEKTS